MSPLWCGGVAGLGGHRVEYRLRGAGRSAYTPDKFSLRDAAHAETVPTRRHSVLRS